MSNYVQIVLLLLNAVLLAVFVNSQTFIIVHQELSVYRYYICDCLVGNVTCPVEQGNYTTHGTRNRTTSFYECKCQEDINCTQYHRQRDAEHAGAQQAGEYRVSNFSECGFSKDDVTHSPICNQSNVTLYLVDGRQTSTKSINTLKTFHCMDIGSTNCSSCMDTEQIKKNCSDTELPATPTSRQVHNLRKRSGSVSTNLSSGTTENTTLSSTPENITSSTTTTATEGSTSSITTGNATDKVSALPTSTLNASSTSTSTSTPAPSDNITKSENSASNTTHICTNTSTVSCTTANKTDICTNTSTVSCTKTSSDITTESTSMNITEAAVTEAAVTEAAITEAAAILEAEQSDDSETVGLIVICVIVGLSLLVAVGVCAFIVCQRRKITVNYKRQHKKHLENNSRVVEERNDQTDNTELKMVATSWE